MLPKKTSQWMYRGQHPNWIARFLNRVSAIVASLGFTRNYMETLEVIGRKSGNRITFPVVITPFQGQSYIVSMLGDEVQWVRNVRAAEGKAWLHAGKRTLIHLEEIAPEERQSILKAYLQRAPGARPHIPVSKDAPLRDFAAIAKDYPVFRLQESP